MKGARIVVLLRFTLSPRAFTTYIIFICLYVFCYKTTIDNHYSPTTKTRTSFYKWWSLVAHLLTPLLSFNPFICWIELLALCSTFCILLSPVIFQQIFFTEWITLCVEWNETFDGLCVVWVLTAMIWLYMLKWLLFLWLI